MSFYRVYELLCANEKSNNKRIKRLINNGRLYNAADALNDTLLHYAATAGNYEIVKYLVDSGSEINKRNNFGSTPLVSTLKTKFPCKKIIEILLQARANIHLQDDCGKSALSILEANVSSSEDSKWIDIYKIFLENAKYFQGFSLLQFGNEKMINALMQANVDMLLKDSLGVSLVHMIAQNQTPGIMAMLRAKYNFDINLRCTYCRWTPLMYAASGGSISATTFLLGEGANIDAVDNKGQTASYNTYAVFNFHEANKDCFQILLERGANPQIEIARYDSSHTILDIVLMRNEDFGAGNLLLAQLALQEAKGIELSQLIRSTIESHNQFKSYFDHCKQQLPTNIYRSITLFDVLAANDRKLERYLRDKELTSKLLDSPAVEYFHTLKRKLLLKAKLMIELRNTAALIMSEVLIEIDYERYPSILDEIVSYLEEEDIKCLISIQNELSR